MHGTSTLVPLNNLEGAPTPGEKPGAREWASAELHKRPPKQMKR